MNAAQSRGGVAFSFKNELTKIQRALQSAKKDNDFIYHDKVPDVKTLSAIGRAAIAKPTPVPTRFSSNFTGTYVTSLTFFCCCFFFFYSLRVVLVILLF